MVSILTYLWIVPAGMFGIGMLMLTSPKQEYRGYGYAWILWASIIFLVWCATGASDMWAVGLFGIVFSVYGYWRNDPNPKSAAELESECGINERK